MKTSPIIALDFDSSQKVFDFLQPFESNINVKVGMQLYYSKQSPLWFLRERVCQRRADYQILDQTMAYGAM